MKPIILKNIIIIICCLYLMPVSVSSAETKPVRIGATVSLEGKFSEPSAMIQGGYKLWESQVNKRGGLLGRSVQLILYDDKSDEKLVRRLYEKLIKEDKVDLVFSPYGTPLTLVASEVSEKHGHVMLASGASGEKIWERGYKNVFGMYATANRYFIGLLDLMARNGLKSVAILYENSSFNIDVAAGIESWAKQFGLKVAFSKGYQSGKIDLPGLLSEARAVNPDGIMLSAYPADGYLLLHLMEQTKYRPKVVGITIAPSYPDFHKEAGNMAEGVFGPSQWEPDERIPFPGTKNFIRDYKSFTDNIPSYHAGSSYASCQIIENAITHNNSFDQKKIRDFISSLDTVTVIGRFKVDQTGKQIGHNPILIQWQKGEKQIVYPTKMQTAPPKF
ncbi:MAG: amino acid ABC transporter substrate-binding protein [Desulfobacterales bacterium]|nr:amino acid ABC transporter substrate-binding protein [Desulfobacterales bacterium]